MSSAAAADADFGGGSSASASSPEHFIELGQTVLICVNDKSQWFIVVTADNTFSVNKMRFRTKQLVGARFGSVFQVNGDKSLELIESGELDMPISFEIGSGADNRNLSIIAGAHKQSLTSEAISDMRSKGSSGADIVEALVENSSTFASKTKFAQEKYILRKQRKHVVRFRVIKPSAHFICDEILRRQPDKVCGLRSDSLSQMLTSADVRSGDRVMVCDGTSGVLLGAVIERMGSRGLIAAPMTQQVTNTPAWAHISKFNLGGPFIGSATAADAAATSAAAAAGAGDGAAAVELSAVPASLAAAAPVAAVSPAASAPAASSSSSSSSSSAAPPPPPSSAPSSRIIPPLVLLAVGYPQMLDAATSVCDIRVSLRGREAALEAAAAAAASGSAEAASGGASAGGPSSNKRPRQEEAGLDADAGGESSSSSAGGASSAAAANSSAAKEDRDAGGMESGDPGLDDVDHGGVGNEEDDAGQDDEGDEGAGGEDAEGEGGGGAAASSSSAAASAASAAAGGPPPGGWKRHNKQLRKARNADRVLTDPSFRHQLKPLRIPAWEMQSVLLSGFDSLLIAVPFPPSRLVFLALRFMRPGATLCVFSPQLPHLADCHRRLRMLGVASQLELRQTWFREYQVLSNRTHPTMSMHVPSGYLLTGTVLANPYCVVDGFFTPPPPGK